MKNLTRTTLISLATLTALSLGAWATCSDNVDMGGFKIVNVADPEEPQDVANKKYIDNLVEELKPILDERFSRNNDIFIVTDHNTGLEWQDNFHVADEDSKLNWSDAMDYCNTLELADGGWRLPSKNELMSIVKDDSNPHISEVFQNTAFSDYWSATKNVDNNNRAWVVDFYFGNVDGNYNSLNAYVRCVRAGE